MVGSETLPAGDDQLFDEAGTNNLVGGDGADTLLGGLGLDILNGGDDSDQLDGGIADDLLDGGGGNDDLNGGEDGDRLSGGAGNDLLNGQVGDGVLLGGSGNDVLSGEDLIDVRGYANIEFADLDTTTDPGSTVIDLGLASGGAARIHVLTAAGVDELGSGDFLFA
jgi:Ca2+-binding RTX toxin-like protein